MADINEEARIPVYINDQQAKSAMLGLQADADNLRKKMLAALADGDPRGAKKLETELRKVKKQMSEVRKASFDVNKVLNDLGNASEKDLQKSIKLLKQQRTDFRRRSADYKEFTNKIKLVRAELNKVNAELHEQKSLVTRAADGFNRYFTMAGTAVAALAGVQYTARQTMDKAIDREEKKDAVEALTGLSKDTIEELEDMAKKVATSLSDQKVRLKKSVNEILDAYGLVGSKRPELLKDAKALHNVTKDAMILAEAGKTSLEGAASTHTAILNQFELAAEESRRVINIVAAGNQKGSGNVEYQGAAIEKFGTQAKLMGIEVEEAFAVIETIAPKFSEPTTAGNSFEKVLIKLKARSIGYKDGVFDLNRAIDELRGMYDSGTTAADIFDVEHAKMGEILVQNQDRLKYFTKELTDTNKAVDLAAINTENMAAKRAQARNEMEEEATAIGEKLMPAQVLMLRSGKLMLKMLGSAIDFYSKYKIGIIGVATALGTYWTMMKIAAHWTKVTAAYTAAYKLMLDLQAASTNRLTLSITYATIKQKLWNLAQKSNPIGLLAGLLIGAGVALYAYSKKLGSVTEAQKTLNEVERKVQENVVEEKVRMEQLLRVAKNELLTKEKRIAAIEELKRIAPDYLGNLTLEKINTEEATTATENYIKSLAIKARMQAAQDKLVELEKERIDELDKGNDKRLSFWQKLGVGVAASYDASAAGSAYAETAATNAAKSEQNYLDKKNALLGLLDQEIVKQIELENNRTGNGGGGSSKTYSTELEALDSYHAQQKLKSKQQYASGNLSKIEYDAKMLEHDVQYYSKKLALQERYKESTIDTENALLDLSIQVREKHEKTWENAVKLMEKAFSKLKDEDAEPEVDLMPVDIEALDAALDKYNELLKLREQLGYEKEVAYDFSFGGVADWQADQNEINRELLNARLIDYDQYEQKMDEIAEEAASRRYAITQSYFDKAGQLASMGSELVQSFQDLETASIQNKVDQGIISEEEGEKQKKKILKKYADVQFAMKASEIISNTAVAVMTALAQLGPIAGPIAAALMSATGVAQLAIANKERKNAKGYYVGGYTETGDPRDEAGIVHKNEFVANREAVGNPQVKPLLDVIDIAQRNNSIANLSLPDILSATYGVPSSSSSSTNTANTAQLMQAASLMLRAAQRMQNIRALVDYRDIEEKSKEMEYLQTLNK